MTTPLSERQRRLIEDGASNTAGAVTCTISMERSIADALRRARVRSSFLDHHMRLATEKKP